MTISKETSSNTNVYNATATQISQGLILQHYCNSVIAQPIVDFSADKNLLQLQTDVNNALSTASAHANNYLNTISPKIISCLSNLDNYFVITLAVPVTCPVGSTVTEWLASLNEMKILAESYKQNASNLATSLLKISADFKYDSTIFDSLATQVNNQINGDDGELNKIKGELSSINTEIAGESVGIAFGALDIVGAVFVIAVGACATFVTVGTSSELVIGGVVALGAGIGVETGTSIALHALINQKNEILVEQALLNSELALITGFNTSLDDLSSQANNAYIAAQAMESAWEGLSSDLESYINDLSNGITSPDSFRVSFLNVANTEIANIRIDITTIKSQMAGVTVANAPRGTTLNNFINPN